LNLVRSRFSCCGHFYELGKFSYGGGIATRIALAILGVQSAGFALFSLRAMGAL